MIMYRTYKWLPEIVAVNVEEKRNGKVWLNRYYNVPVVSPFWCYHDTWQAAKRCLADQAKVSIITAKNELITAKDRLKKVQRLKKKNEIL